MCKIVATIEEKCHYFCGKTKYLPALVVLPLAVIFRSTCDKRSDNGSHFGATLGSSTADLTLTPPDDWFSRGRCFTPPPSFGSTLCVLAMLWLESFQKEGLSSSVFTSQIGGWLSNCVSLGNASLFIEACNYAPAFIEPTLASSFSNQRGLDKDIYRS